MKTRLRRSLEAMCVTGCLVICLTAWYSFIRDTHNSAVQANKPKEAKIVRIAPVVPEVITLRLPKDTKILRYDGTALEDIDPDVKSNYVTADYHNAVVREMQSKLEVYNASLIVIKTKMEIISGDYDDTIAELKQLIKVERVKNIDRNEENKECTDLEHSSTPKQLG